MTITTNGYSHVRITVTDIAASRAFYEGLFGWPVAIEMPQSPDDATREALSFLDGGVLYDVGGGRLFGLRPVGSDAFDENRVGLDHVSFQLTSRDELEAAVETLDERGIAHEPITDAGAIWILQFRDPDNVALELAAPHA